MKRFAVLIALFIATPAFAQQPATITVTVPADARVWIDGQLMTKGGTRRVYTTPAFSGKGRYLVEIQSGERTESYYAEMYPNHNTPVWWEGGTTAAAHPFKQSSGLRLGEVAVVPDVETIERQLPFLKLMEKYSPAKNTQSLYQTRPLGSNQPFERRADPVPRSLLKQKWQVPGHTEGVQGWHSVLYRYVADGGVYWRGNMLLPVLNSSGYIQHELGHARSYADGSMFADVLSNDKGNVFEVRVAEKMDGQWTRYVAFKDVAARPANYVPPRSKDCVACHAEAGSGGYAVGMVPGGDTIISDPFRGLE